MEIKYTRQGDYLIPNFMINNFIKNDEKLSEKSKNSNQLEWVKLMNNYKKTAEEIIKKEIIYV